MGTYIVIVLGLFLVASLTMAASTGRRGSTVRRSGDPERLLALEFRGVVVGNERMAHAFDAGYSCRVKIKCDDGATVTMDRPIFEQYKYPVGSRVVKRVGQTVPEPDTGPAPPPQAPVEDS
jgi:hypothetical protein